MGIRTVFEFKEKEGDRIWRSLFVKPNWSSAQPKSQSGVWFPVCSLSKAVPCSHCWGWRGKQGRAIAKVNNVRGVGFLFYLANLPNPVPMQKSCCVHNVGRHRLLWHNARCFWATVCEEKTCIHLNCLIMLQDELSMLNGPQTSCVYFQACWSSHLTCSLSKVCISLLLPFLFSH